MLAVLSPRHVITAAVTLGSAAYIRLSSLPSGAEGMKPIQSPITGNEDLGDLSQPQQALAQFTVPLHRSKLWNVPYRCGGPAVSSISTHIVAIPAILGSFFRFWSTADSCNVFAHSDTDDL